MEEIYSFVAEVIIKNANVLALDAIEEAIKNSDIEGYIAIMKKYLRDQEKDRLRKLVQNENVRENMKKNHWTILQRIGYEEAMKIVVKYKNIVEQKMADKNSNILNIIDIVIQEVNVKKYLSKDEIDELRNILIRLKGIIYQYCHSKFIEEEVQKYYESEILSLYEKYRDKYGLSIQYQLIFKSWFKAEQVYIEACPRHHIRDEYYWNSMDFWRIIMTLPSSNWLDEIRSELKNIEDENYTDALLNIVISSFDHWREGKVDFVSDLFQQRLIAKSHEKISKSKLEKAIESFIENNLEAIANKWNIDKIFPNKMKEQEIGVVLDYALSRWRKDYWTLLEEKRTKVFEGISLLLKTFKEICDALKIDDVFLSLIDSTVFYKRVVFLPNGKIKSAMRRVKREGTGCCFCFAS